MLTVGELFAGIGGISLGLEWAGLGPVKWHVEKDEFCRRVLAKHWPGVPTYDDVRAVDATVLEPVDVLCGGFPCQPFSAAGKGLGFADPRGNMWAEFARLAGELRPRFVVVENVASGARRWLPFVRRDLHLLGYDTRAFSLSAFDVGAPHLRRRVFVVAADAHRLEQRQQPGRSRGAHGARAAVAHEHGASGTVADARGARLEERGEQPARQERAAAQRDRVPRDAWAVEPDVGRVASRVPDRAHRLRALGNSVVPQCAEVIGRIVLDLATPPGPGERGGDGE